jgi:hypothetical protein
VAGKYTFKATYNGTTCSSVFDIVSGAGVNSQESVSDIKIYPNPSDGRFIIESGNRQTLDFEIYNVLGEKVIQSIISNPIAIESKTEIKTDLQSGMYFYLMKDSGQFISSGKLFVQ